MKIEEGSNLYLVMEEIDSHHPPTKIMAKEYSDDGIIWKPVPHGIEVRGSRYAIVLDELQEGDLDIDLSEYIVAAGPSTGKVAGEYITGRVDKACITKGGKRSSFGEPKIKTIHHSAKIKAPYAVFMR
jgi:hypothetical protein